jgi:hypothetical protein
MGGWTSRAGSKIRRAHTGVEGVDADGEQLHTALADEVCFENEQSSKQLPGLSAQPRRTRASAYGRTALGNGGESHRNLASVQRRLCLDEDHGVFRR